MRMNLIVFTIFLFSTVYPLENKSLFDSEKVKEYEKISMSNLNPAIFYNLGLYYSINTNVGKAILNLKRAYYLSPYDREIKLAFENERKKLDYPLFTFQPSLLEEIFAFPFNFAGINVIALIGIVLLSTGSLGITFLYFYGGYNRKKTFTVLSIILFFTGIIYVASAIVRYNITFDKREAVIINQSEIYDSISENPIQIASLPAGMECKIIKEEGEYFLILTVNGKEGWLKTNNVERLW